MWNRWVKTPTEVRGPQSFSDIFIERWIASMRPHEPNRLLIDLPDLKIITAPSQRILSIFQKEKP